MAMPAERPPTLREPVCLPSSPPHRKKSRFGLGGLVAALVALVVLGWIAIVFKSAERELNFLVAARRAAGQPMLPEDVARRKAISDDDNAAFHLARAVAAMPRIEYV